MEFNILYKDENLLAIDKPSGVITFPEENIKEKTLIDYLVEKLPELQNTGEKPRYGIVHRLDKDTSGVLLVAKNNQTLEFLQKQFQEGKITKKYLALVTGNLKQNQGTIETLVGRSPADRKKQKIYLENDPKAKDKRKAVTSYKLLENFENYALIEAEPKTGRKHQIRTHLAYLGHPIAGDRVYSFKNQPIPKDLRRQFLHATSLKITLPNNQTKEFKSELPKDLKNILTKLK